MFGQSDVPAEPVAQIVHAASCSGRRDHGIRRKTQRANVLLVNVSKSESITVKDNSNMNAKSITKTSSSAPEQENQKNRSKARDQPGTVPLRKVQ